MSNASSHEPIGHGSAPPRPFSDAEWESLQTEDVHGAKMVVGLMSSIFTIGLLLYIGVCYAVKTNW